MGPPMSAPASVAATIATVRPVPPPMVEPTTPPTTAPAIVPFCSLVGGVSQATRASEAMETAARLRVMFMSGSWLVGRASRDSLSLGHPPCLVRVEARHGSGDRGRACAEVLLVYGALVVHEESHHARSAVAGGPCH